MLNTTPTNISEMVQLIDHMGDDLTIVNAARVSMDTRHRSLTEGDVRLINFLAKAEPKHWSPFSHAMLSFRISAPMFVARQWFKHTIGCARANDGHPGWNELSRRYVSTAPEYFVFDRLRTRPTGGIKQGSGGELYKPVSDKLMQLILNHYEASSALYQVLVGDNDVCPEQARAVLPMGHMTSWIETGSLWFWIRFLQHRDETTAQKEIQDYAAEIKRHVKNTFPHCAEAAGL